MAPQIQNTGSFDPLDGIIAEYLQALESGNAPARESLLARHPEQAERLYAFFRDFDAVGQDASKFRLPPSNRTSETITHDKAVAVQIPKVQYLGDYELQSEIARGGMGVVYRAKQVSLNRPVAVKMILAGTYATSEAVQRFRAEAEAAANLDHPNILPIYEVGEHEGHQYFSMKLVEGGSLSGKIDELKSKPKQIAELMATLAKAVHFAHQRGILHRDLKPANVLMDADGTPYVTDFGLAKKVDADDGSTRTGSIVGTPSYMAPEQARGEKGLTTSVDVYSLGAILYEMLTGQPPFKGETIFETVKQVIEREASHPRSLNALADRDLSVIALKCLNKEASQRYSSAGELTADLERFARGEAILARPTGGLERGYKWVKRNPVLTAMAAVVFLAVASGTAFSLRYAILAEAQSLSARQRLYVLSMRQAQNSLEKNHIRNLRMGLAEYGPDSPDHFLTGWEWHYLRRQAYGAQYSLEWSKHNPVIEGVGWNPEGTQFAALGRDGTLAVYRFPEQTLIFRTDGRFDWGIALEYRPDGKIIAVAEWDGQVHLCDAFDGSVRFTLPRVIGQITSVKWHPNGRYLGILGESDSSREIREAMIWDTEKGDYLHRWKGSYTHIDFPPHQPNQVVLADRSGLRFHEIESGQLLRTQKEGQYALKFAFDPTGERIAIARQPKEFHNELTVYDTKTWKKISECVGHNGNIRAIQFFLDGKQLATGGEDYTIRIWDAITGKEQKRLRSGNQWNLAVALRPQQDWLLSGGQSNLLELWQLDYPLEWKEADVRFLGVKGYAINPGLPQIARSNRFGVQLVSTENPKQLINLDGIKNCTALKFSNDGKTIAVGELTGAVRLFETEKGTLLWSCSDLQNQITSIAWCGDNARLAAASRPGLDWIGNTVAAPPGQRDEVIVWESLSGRKLQSISTPELEELSRLRLDQEGKTLWTATGQLKFQAWNVSTGEPSGTGYEKKGFANWSCNVLPSPDGKYLALSTGSDSIQIFASLSWEQVHVLSGHTGKTVEVAFSPDSRRLATSSQDGSVRLWDLATGQELISFEIPIARPSDLRFSEDGKQLIVALENGLIRIWDARPANTHSR